MNRQDVYKVIDDERAYQIEKWGDDSDKSIKDFLFYMNDYMNRANESARQYGDLDTLDELRKVVALGIACFEVHGMIERGI